MIHQQPERLPRPFAASGDRNEIPDVNENPSPEKNTSWSKGFPVETSKPLDAGGVPPARTDLNGVFNALSSDVCFQQSGGIYEWSDETDYDVSAMVKGSDGAIYCSVTSSGPGMTVQATDPVGDTGQTAWKMLDAFISPDVTLTASAHYGPTANVDPGYSGTFKVPDVTVSANGRVTAAGEKTITMPPPLGNSGVTAGTYGLTQDANPPHEGSFTVPTFTVNAQGRVTAAADKTVKLPSSKEYLLRSEVLDLTYPVGSIYLSASATNPAKLFGGTWKQLAGSFLLGCNGSHPVGQMGGSENATLGTANLPAHNHPASTAGAGGHTPGGSISTTGNHNHTATTSTTGNHSHNRGNMEIWGKFYGHCVGYNTGRGEGAFGGYRYGDRAAGGGYGGMSAGWDFYASRHWTGNTSTTGNHNHTLTTTTTGNHSHTFTGTAVGNHTHTVTVDNAGEGKAFSIMPPFLSVYMWQRTS